jgi:aminoglycoside 3-N-acetyltransferase
MSISFDDACAAIRAAGAKHGDVVFSHHNIAFFGRIENCLDINDFAIFWLDVFREVIGEAGTLIVPAFTYSFGSDKGEKVFDPVSSLPNTGAIGTYAALRGLGSEQFDLAHEVGPICFGANSIWERLFNRDALVCNLNLDSGSTYLHWIEREVGVEYRHDIAMRGSIRIDSITMASEVVYTGRDIDDASAAPSFSEFHRKCVEHEITTQVKLGRGQINSYRCQKVADFTRGLLLEYPRLLTKAAENA